MYVYVYVYGDVRRLYVIRCLLVSSCVTCTSVLPTACTDWVFTCTMHVHMPVCLQWGNSLQVCVHANHHRSWSKITSSSYTKRWLSWQHCVHLYNRYLITTCSMLGTFEFIIATCRWVLSSATATVILLSTASRYIWLCHLSHLSSFLLPSSSHFSFLVLSLLFSLSLPLSLCSDGIDAVRGCVEEMKGQLPLDGVATSSRMVSASLFSD